MVIVVIDNGAGAEEIARFVRGAKIVKPGENVKADAFILSDGELTPKIQKANLDLIKSNSGSAIKPILGIGLGYCFIGTAFDAKIKQAAIKADRITVKQRSPILLDMKRVFSVADNQKYVLAELPECFDIVASSTKYEPEAIQHASRDMSEMALPFFGVHFNPELGQEGVKILDNFAKFVEVWAKYHQ